MDNFREWISDHLRYILLGLAVILVLVVVIFAARLIMNAVGERNSSDNVQVTENQEPATSDETQTDETGEGETSSTEGQQGTLTRNDPEILAIVQKYYTAHQEHDTVTLQQIVNPYTEEMENELDDDSIISYNNIETYSQAGPKEGSYIVCVYYEQEIENLDTMVPQLALLYLRTDEEGFLYIADPNEDEETTQAVEDFSEQAEVVAIIDDTKEKTIELRDSDEGVRNWLEQMASSDGETEAQTNQESNSVMYVNADDVNVRASASTDAEILTVLSQGDEVTVLGDSGEEWTNIQFGEITGYVATEYLSEQ